MADSNVQRKLTDGNNRIKGLLARHKDDNAALEELVIATLCRTPTDKERASFKKYLEKKNNRQAAYADMLWALINTTEFALNH